MTLNFKKIAKLFILPIIGIILIMVPAGFGISAMIKPDALTMTTPGTKSFSVAEPGVYTIWYATTGISNDGEFQVRGEELPKGLSFHIRNKSDGTTVPLKSNTGMTVTSGADKKASLAKADLEPGEYELVAANQGGALNLSLSRSVFKFKEFAFGIGSIVLGVLFILAGSVYALVVIIQGISGSAKPPEQAP